MFLEWENNSRRFQNNVFNEVKQISLSHMIKEKIKEQINLVISCFTVVLLI